MADFELSKRHVEGELDDEGYDVQYEHTEMAFDFGERTYRARIYTDSPQQASITPRPRIADETGRADLQAMVDHLVSAESVSQVLILGGPKGTYEPVDPSFLRS